MNVLKRINKLDPYYHNFADKNKYMDILSNIFLFIAGLCIIINFKHKKIKLLGFHVIILSIASAYYHINPNNDTIFFDLLSIALISSLLIIYLLKIKNNTINILIYLLGIGVVVYWKYSKNLLPYSILWIFTSLLLLIVYYNTKYIHKSLFIIFLIILLRIIEIYDKEIFILTKHILSGHTLKHILASIAIYLIAELLSISNIL